MSYRFELVFHNNSNESVSVQEKVPEYSISALADYVSLLCPGEVVKISPLYTPDCLGKLGTSPVYGLVARNEDNQVIEAFPLTNDALVGGIADVITDLRSRPEFEDRQIVSWELLSDGEDLVTRSKPLQEKLLKDFDLTQVGHPRLMPKVFAGSLLGRLQEFAVSRDEQESMATLYTDWYWDTEIGKPWLHVHTMVPYADSEISSSEGFVKVHTGALTQTLGKPTSLFHTHVIDDPKYQNVAVFSPTDKQMFRHHLRSGQISLIGNIVKGRPDLGCAYHLYAWQGGDVSREGFYVAREKDEPQIKDERGKML